MMTCNLKTKCLPLNGELGKITTAASTLLSRNDSSLMPMVIIPVVFVFSNVFKICVNNWLIFNNFSTSILSSFFIFKCSLNQQATTSLQHNKYEEILYKWTNDDHCEQANRLQFTKFSLYKSASLTLWHFMWGTTKYLK